jgi:hypothetical protein
MDDDAITRPLRVMTLWEVYWTSQQQDRRQRKLRRARRRWQAWQAVKLTVWTSVQVVLAVRFAFVAETQLLLVIAGGAVVLVISWWAARIYRARQRHRWRVALWRYKYVHGEPLPHPAMANHRQHYHWAADLRRALFNPPGVKMTRPRTSFDTVQRRPIDASQWDRLIR